ncbi:hypothetical protein GCM10009007_12830 [Formosimonas limnophila]|uniref:Uncharacterized protein n=1 Tax=Formosimonas limnophila TaxID=1384487 RepID=A0A8J3CMZ8_9BURK|nr:hypothetical protein GCM10009007_12830 [Formosimonas limnophila]
MAVPMNQNQTSDLRPSVDLLSPKNVEHVMSKTPKDIKYNQLFFIRGFLSKRMMSKNKVM